MINAPKSLRLQIGIFGRTNVGKSSLLNMLAEQDVALTSPIPGTTTDVVEKSMELLPIGPVTILDTAGLDDVSILSELRIERTMKILDRADIIIIVIEPNRFTIYEEEIIALLNSKKIPYVFVINKIDEHPPNEELINKLENLNAKYTKCSTIDYVNRDKYRTELKHILISKLPDDFLKPPPLISDLIHAGGICIMVVPIDKQAPKGRLILPQVQAIREALDSDAITLVVKESEYAKALKIINKEPDIVICDSQVVLKIVDETPKHLKTTTFSILFSRNKGDLVEETRGAAVINKLKPNDKILIAEACSHHPTEDDIGRVKIPRWLTKYLGFDLNITIAAGRDFPDDLKQYKLIIHCGSCMLTRNEKLVRIMKAKESDVPITNYGIAISLMQGVLGRALSPFNEALIAYREAIE